QRPRPHVTRPEPPTDLTDAVLAAKAGSVTAFEDLYRALAPTAAAYLRWNGVGDVESLTNEAMAQLHRNLGRFTGDGAAFRSWVCSIAYHRMVGEGRSVGRRPVLSWREVQEPAVTGDAGLGALDALSDQELQSLLDVLSPDQRAGVLLRIVAGLPS